MKINLSNKYSAIVGILIIILLGVTMGSGWTFFNADPLNNTVIRVEEQKDSPILIQSSTLLSSNPLKPTYSYFVNNVSNKTIRAYAIKVDSVLDNGGVISGVTLNNPISEAQFLKPKINKSESGGQGTAYSASVSEIVLSVDFVEFDDGTTWGKDSYDSSELLVGQKAGTIEVIKYFQNKLNLRNTEEFLFDIDNFDEKVLTHTSSSKMFNKGYKTGVKFVINRLKKAKDESGMEAIKIELNSYDLSRGMRK